ncbi:MAG: TIGR02757 family protein [Candidatus Fermentibacteraceae bacterium]
MTEGLGGLLENLYVTWNRREFVHPDPLEFLYGYDDPDDREIVGLLASSLAYGRVTQILRSVASVLGMMGDNPSKCSPSLLREKLAGFRHRFTPGDSIADIFAGARRLQQRHGSLGAFVSHEVSRSGLLEAQRLLVKGILESGGPTSLLPCPSRGSCCKRLNLWFRWMVRRDAVDPGGWDGVSRSALLVPLDTHMWKVGRSLGFTSRRSPDLKAVLEITDGFRGLCPGDPVRYDFTLTRFGIRSGLSIETLLAELDRQEGK